MKYDDLRDGITDNSGGEYTTTRYYDPENISDNGISKKVKKPGNTAKGFYRLFL